VLAVPPAPGAITGRVTAPFTLVPWDWAVVVRQISPVGGHPTRTARQRPNRNLAPSRGVAEGAKHSDQSP
jgi:hypothetical protein